MIDGLFKLKVLKTVDKLPFCTFCIFEAHIKGLIANKEKGNLEVFPLTIIPLLKKIEMYPD
jgi:hypothetical protein